MKWKVLAFFMLVMFFLLGALLLYVFAIPKEVNPVSFEIPQNSNPNIDQKFIQGSIPMEGKKIHDPPMSKELFQEVDFEIGFVQYRLSQDKKQIFLTWYALNSNDNQEILVTEEEPLDLPKIKFLNSVKTVEFRFAKEQIVIETETFWSLTIGFSLILFVFSVLVGCFIWKFR